LNKIVIIVDDGIATGATIIAAISALKTQECKKIITAVPVSADYAAEKIKHLVNEFVCLETSPDFDAVGSFYMYFPQVEDNEVIEILSSQS